MTPSPSATSPASTASVVPGLGAHLTEVAASQQRLEQRRLPGVGVSDDGKPKG